jgi:hypothetical protein
MEIRQDAPAPVVKFHRVLPGAISPMPADKSALGSMPAAAHQYCEALRAASGFGWYIFPPKDILLRWDGAQTFYSDGEGWLPLTNVVDPEHAAYWDAHCPEDLRGGVPSYMSALFVPGVVQIWSGLLVSTAPDWSVLVRPLANLAQPRSHACFEGIIETDWFKPVPLFINMRVTATDVAIEIPRTRPLFQIQPLHRAAYTQALKASTYVDGLEEGAGLTEQEWAGFRNTVRSISFERPPDVGRYGAEVRRRGR